MPANIWVMRIWDYNLKLDCFLSLCNQISLTDLPVTDVKLNRAYSVELTLTMKKLLYIMCFLCCHEVSRLQ